MIFGSAGGISTSGYFRIDEESLPDVSQGKFGTSLAVGLFNNDEHMDIAVGSPMARVGSQSFAGSVTLFFGSASGFSMDEHEIVTQNTYYHGGGVQDRAEYLDQFGYSLAAGRINDDRFDDLVVGAAGETNSEASMAGAVHVLYNDSRQRNVFDLRKDKLLSQQNLPGDSPEDIDFFGYALALGDYDRNGFDDLAVGVPYDSLDGYSDAGIVQVSYSDATGGLNTDPAPDDHPTLQNIDQGGSSTADWPAEGPY